MRRRPVLSADKYRTQVEKPNPDPSRPTIKYDPVNAIHSVHKEDHHQQKNGGVKDNNHGDDNKDFPFATRQQQKITHSEPKKPSVSDYNNHPKSPISEEEEDKGAENGEEEEVENEELSDIIESIDEKSSGGDDDRGKVDASVVDGGEGFHHQRKDDDDIQPVVIPFDFDLKTVTMKEEKGGGKGSDFEPVWRRKPPEKTTTATETTEKNVEATKKIEG
jgi:hypothetical protein